MQKNVTVLVDDIDGTPAQHTREFTHNGQRYVIDLNDEHVQDFDQVVATLIPHARKAGKAGAAKASSTKTADRIGVNPSTIRAWATQQGYEVSGRGRLPEAIVADYMATVAAQG